MVKGRLDHLRVYVLYMYVHVQRLQYQYQYPHPLPAARLEINYGKSNLRSIEQIFLNRPMYCIKLFSWETVRTSGAAPLSAAQESGILKVQ